MLAYARGAWLTNRDIAAALSSWQRARGVADALPDDHPDRLSMRIAPRTLLCGSAWRVAISIAGAPFEELRELCAATGDEDVAGRWPGGTRDGADDCRSIARGFPSSHTNTWSCSRRSVIRQLPRRAVIPGDRLEA